MCVCVSVCMMFIYLVGLNSLFIVIVNMTEEILTVKNDWKKKKNDQANWVD